MVSDLTMFGSDRFGHDPRYGYGYGRGYFDCCGPDLLSILAGVTLVVGEVNMVNVYLFFCYSHMPKISEFVCPSHFHDDKDIKPHPPKWRVRLVNFKTFTFRHWLADP